MSSIYFILEQTYDSYFPFRFFHVHDFEKKDDFACNHLIDVWLLLKHHTDAEETPRHRKVRRPYVVLTQYIFLNTPMIKIVHRSIAYDILWIKKYAIGSL